ncbi:triosephosphate isomerase [Rhodothalassium salexigens DSM 2132]|uniref:Triosephosphate isomerase n=1 Tax=Rhodothalassium salexigens DSM 2132 TaxID=1188247 RepID=A0A4R2PV96_RHOSA|nr:triose-phosphate isomerase [Rhodothalassium salexigens]MBB4209966.1 triosephosphate isomerase [Rhodothalassium salexigens DSM 2132]MBK1637662.1 triose-phosphate isomerase [Rhodothalassium salexigens DSM 2132]TCP38131.1 triosephosphate isomerase [Rhodothalassium salexigens DSM 2132]
MVSPRRRLVAGNWKMNGSFAHLGAYMDALVQRLTGAEAACDVMICPPHPLVSLAVTATEACAERCQPIAVAGQDCHGQDQGAHTGDVAAGLLAELGAKAVIVGHSERRTDHGEDDATVAAKAAAAHRAGLTAIVCVGEALAVREAGDHEATVCAQLAASLPDGATPANTVVAYEPIWAIGTGRVAEVGDIAPMHQALRRTLEARLGAGAAALRLLYGGSVKPGNAAEIAAVDGVDGLLVGGASLKADDFDAILDAYRR